MDTVSIYLVRIPVNRVLVGSCIKGLLFRSGSTCGGEGRLILIASQLQQVYCN